MLLHHKFSPSSRATIFCSTSFLSFSFLFLFFGDYIKATVPQNRAGPVYNVWNFTKKKKNIDSQILSWEKEETDIVKVCVRDRKRENKWAVYVRRFFKQFYVRLIGLREIDKGREREKILNIYSTRLAKTAPFVSELRLWINFAGPALRVSRD